MNNHFNCARHPQLGNNLFLANNQIIFSQHGDEDPRDESTDDSSMNENETKIYDYIEKNSRLGVHEAQLKGLGREFNNKSNIYPYSIFLKYWKKSKWKKPFKVC